MSEVLPREADHKICVYWVVYNIDEVHSITNKKGEIQLLSSFLVAPFFVLQLAVHLFGWLVHLSILHLTTSGWAAHCSLVSGQSTLWELEQLRQL